jgi:hypothetical protein
MSSEREVIETRAAAELARCGEQIPGRRASWARVIAAGRTDDDIDGMITQAQKEVGLPGLGVFAIVNIS